MHKITITKIDHDDYYGYYIDDRLYQYCEYNRITPEEVKFLALLEAMEDGLIKNRFEADIVFREKYDLPNYSDEADEESINNLPNSLEDLLAMYKSFV